MAGDSKSKGLKDLPRVQLKYPSLDAFARAARKTFKLGRMTLKSRKVFKLGNRLVLDFKMPDHDKPVEVIGEVIDVVPPKKGTTATYGIRFLNFTEKKLDRLLKAPSEAAHPARKEKAPPSKAAKPNGHPPSETRDPEEGPEAKPGTRDEETDVYTIEAGDDNEFMSFDSRTQESEPEPTPSFEMPVDQAESQVAEQQTPSDQEEMPDISITTVQPEYKAQEAEPSISPPDEQAGEEPGVEPEPEPLPPEEIEAPQPEEAIPPEPPFSQEAQEAPVESDFMEEKAIETPELGPLPEPEEGPSIPEPGPAPEPEPMVSEPPKELSLKPMSQAEYQALADFLLRLSRILIQPLAGESPEAGRILKSLYEEFKSIMNGRDEIGIFLRTSSTGKDFMLEGTDPEPKSIKAVFSRETSANLVIKLADLFEKKGLIGITLRRYSTGDAFQKFVEILSGYSQAGSSIEEVVRSLVQSGAYHLSPIFVQDQIPDAERLHWRVAMALSRLSGEMRRLILTAEAIQEDPRALFTLRVEDAIKPIQKPELFAELLFSCRLAITGQTEFSEADLQSEIIFALPLDKLVQTCELLALTFEDVFTELRSKPEEKNLIEREKTIRKTLRRALARVSFEAAETGMKILRHLYSKRVLSYEELPEVLRGRIDAEQAADEFGKDPRHELEAFERTARPEQYKKQARQMAYVIIELLRRGQSDLADLGFRVLANHRTQKTPPFPERPRMAKDAMQVFTERDSVPVMLEKFSSGNKEEREIAASLFYAAGERVIPVMLDLLAESEDRGVRRMVCDILIRLGDKVTPLLREKLFEKDIPWYLARNLVMVLGEIRSPLLMKDLDMFIGHDHPRVREEALNYLVRVSKSEGASGEDPEPKLVRSLRDSDPMVRRRAVQLLGQLRDLSDFTIQGLVWMMEKKSEAAPTKEEELLFIQTAELLGKAKGRRLPEGRTLEDALIKIVESESRGLFGRIAGGKGRTPRMRASVIDALGRIGTEKSRKLLAQASRDKNDVVKKSAQTALARVKASEKDK